MQFAHITHLGDFDWMRQVRVKKGSEVKHTDYGVVDDDNVQVYSGRILGAPEGRLQEMKGALCLIPNDRLYPRFCEQFRIAPCALFNNADKYFMKRPWLTRIWDQKPSDTPNAISLGLREEIETLEDLSQHPHPGLVRYHGCVVQKGWVLGLILDRYKYDLHQYLKVQERLINTSASNAPAGRLGGINVEVFMAALEEALRFLHSLGYAHNDLKPQNIMVDEARGCMPVLIDFGSCKPTGKSLGHSGSTEYWTPKSLQKEWKSDVKKDVYALGMLWNMFDTIREKDRMDGAVRRAGRAPALALEPRRQGLL